MTDENGPGWLRRLWQWVRPYRGRVSVALVLAVVGQGLLALVPLVQQIIVDDVLLDPTQSLAFWIAVLCSIGVLSFASHALRRYIGSRCAVDVQHDLRVAVHRHLHALDARRRAELAAGDVISRGTSDLNLIQMFISQVPLFVANLTLLAVGLVVMFVLSPPLFVVVAASVPVLFWVTRRLRRELYPASFGDQVLLGQVAAAVDEEIAGVELIRAFGQEDVRRNRFRDRATRLFASRLRSARISARWSAAMVAIPVFTQLGVLVVGGWLAMNEHVSVGVFLAFASYVLQFAPPARLLAAMVTTMQLARSGARRVFALLDTVPAMDPTGPDLPSPRGTIEVADVDLALGGHPVLQGVTTSITPGSRVAIIGPSGAGKTTLGSLIARQFDPDRGSVRIGGTDLRAVSPRSVRSAVMMVFDESLLFSGTLRENIAMGSPVDDAGIVAAARAAAADEFIEKLPAGYDTVVGPGGISLSGGQRQRIALARAFAADPAVLILDDTTSALDPTTERAVLASLEGLMVGRTTILIARRPATTELADQVIVLEAGRVTHDGPPSEVLADPRVVSLLAGGPGRGSLGTMETAVADAMSGDDPIPSPDSWPEVDEAGADPVVRARLGLDADESGKQVQQVDSHLREALLSLPPLTELPAPGDDRPLPASARTKVFGLTGSLRPFWWPVALCVVLVIVDAATTLAIPALFRHGIDNGVGVDAASVFWATCALVLVIALVSWLNSWVLALRAARVFERVLFALRLRLFGHLQRLRIDYFDGRQSGRIVTRLTSDVDAVGQLMTQGMVNAIVNVCTCAGILVVLALLDIRLAAAMLVTIPLLAAASWIFVRGSNRAYLQARSRIATVTALLSEHLGRVRITQAHNAEEWTTGAFDGHSRRYRDARRRSMLYISVFFPFLNLLAVVAKALILIVGAQLMDAGSLATGVLVAALLYVDLFFTPLQQLSIVLDLWIQARVGTQRMRGFLDTPVDTPVDENVRPATTGTAAGPLGAAVEFDGVVFGYSAATRTRGRPALDGLDLVIPDGETAAVVGTTGAGKSTVMKLLLRFHSPDRGVVRVGGVDLRHVGPGDRGPRIAYVPQDPYLFAGTVASNIAFGRPDAGQAEIERAARSVGAHGSIASLPLGYQTPVGPGRATLSAGQQQLICLARAELVEPDLLILDEATSDIDPGTETEVLAALQAVARKRTTVLVAHRLTTAAWADRVVVMADGRAVQSGRHADLVSAPGPYRDLWQSYAPTDPALSGVVKLSN
ncbi:ABC transporter ATP-binding protein [Gordonia sp. 4N]|uniref:ABC transporter ATP-binding protein n=2 Tax=unclassified Gordonia (in: high G+C Gram-positive bacteria) TaxID=2657482 RepID=UPI002249212A|nr:ABC transporter ATP-binding protein [Gordonia sp. 4N]MCX2753878.1 ABC transporter ATP-binding protein [Gordonia sp. 4N]